MQDTIRPSAAASSGVFLYIPGATRKAPCVSHCVRPRVSCRVDVVPRVLRFPIHLSGSLCLLASKTSGFFNIASSAAPRGVWIETLLQFTCKSQINRIRILRDSL